MELIWTVVIGFVAGLMSKDHRPGTEPGGYWLPCLIGMVSAPLSCLAGGWVGWYRSGQPIGFVMAVIGASLALTVFNTLRRRRAG